MTLPIVSERIQRLMAESDARHSANPSLSFEDYRRTKYAELSDFVRSRKAIYLDMNYWIWLREPACSPFPNQAVQLLDALQKGVRNGRLVCPISYPAFIELMKLNPIDLRRKQAAIMDALSSRVGIRNGFDTAEIEFLDFLFETHRSFRLFCFGSIRFGVHWVTSLSKSIRTIQVFLTK